MKTIELVKDGELINVMALEKRICKVFDFNSLEGVIGVEAMGLLQTAISNFAEDDVKIKSICNMLLHWAERNEEAVFYVEDK